MPVLQATDGIDVLSDHVYGIMPGTVLSFADGRLGVSGMENPHRQPNPIDLLFPSLALALGDKAFGNVSDRAIICISAALTVVPRCTA